MTEQKRRMFIERKNFTLELAKELNANGFATRIFENRKYTVNYIEESGGKYVNAEKINGH